MIRELRIMNTSLFRTVSDMEKAEDQLVKMGLVGFWRWYWDKFTVMPSSEELKFL